MSTPQHTKLWLLAIGLLVAAVVGGFVLTVQSCSDGDGNGQRAKSAPKRPKPTGPWTVTLPSGVTVELVGVSEHSMDGAWQANSPWWAPDGTPLPQAPRKNFGRSGGHAQGKPRQIELMVRMDGEFPGTYGRAWEYFDPDTGERLGGTGWSSSGDVCIGYIFVTVEQPALTVKFGVAATEWEVIASSDETGGETTSRGPFGAAFAPAEEEDGKVKVTAFHNVSDRDVRVVAIVNTDSDDSDNTGDVIASTWHGSRSPANHPAATYPNQIEVSFSGVNLEDIQEFQVQVRPYEWAEFKDVALYPDWPEDSPALSAVEGGDSDALKSRRTVLESQYTDLLNRYGDQHRSVKLLKEKIDALNEQIDELLRANHDRPNGPAFPTDDAINTND